MCTPDEGTGGGGGGGGTKSDKSVPPGRPNAPSTDRPGSSKGRNPGEEAEGTPGGGGGSTIKSDKGVK